MKFGETRPETSTKPPGPARQKARHFRTGEPLPVGEEGEKKKNNKKGKEKKNKEISPDLGKGLGQEGGGEKKKKR